MVRSLDTPATPVGEMPVEVTPAVEVPPAGGTLVLVAAVDETDVAAGVTRSGSERAGAGMTITDTITTSPAVQLQPPALVADKLDAAPLFARGVSFLGTLHELYGNPRQDSFAMASNAKYLIAVVGDGIGSCPHSQHGSAAAAQAVAVAAGGGSVDVEDAAAVLAVAAAAAVDAAAVLGVTARSVSTTLTVALVERAEQGGGGRRVLLHAVGDSPALLLVPATAEWNYLTPEDRGPSNVVRGWVPGRTAEPFSAGFVLPTRAVLVLASDGFTTPLGNGVGPLGASLAERWGRAPRELMDFIMDLSFKAYHDDKTVVAIWNGDPGAPEKLPSQDEVDVEESEDADD